MTSALPTVMRSPVIFLVAFLSVTGCAAPAEEDEDLGEGSGAATADATAAPLAEFRTFFESSQFKIGRAIPFSGKESVQVGTADRSYGGCYAVMRTAAADAVVPAGDVYKVDTKAISLFRDASRVLWWKIPLRDEKVQVGKKGALSDFFIQCGGTYDGERMDPEVITYNLRNGGVEITGPNIKFFH